MASKAKLKEVKSLHLPKFRQIYNKFIAEGGKVCTELINSNKFRPDSIFITENSHQKYYKITSNHKNIIEIISDKEMSIISNLKTHSDILVVFHKNETDISDFIISKSSAIYLDSVQDPGNVGTIIRLADWFGIKTVIRSSETADFFNPKVVQATMGSLANVELFNAELSDLKGCNGSIIGTLMEGESVVEFQFPDQAIIVLGSEGSGISEQNVSMLTHKITIPGSEEKLAESLNVATACSIICALWKLPIL